MNDLVLAQFWCHIPTKGGHLQTVRASDGYNILLDRTSGILTLTRQGEVVEVSPSAWISIAHAPPPPLPPPVEEPTKVWTKPKKK
jgi:hypothetical protein